MSDNSEPCPPEYLDKGRRWTKISQALCSRDSGELSCEATSLECGELVASEHPGDERYCLESIAPGHSFRHYPTGRYLPFVFTPPHPSKPASADHRLRWDPLPMAWELARRIRLKQANTSEALERSRKPPVGQLISRSRRLDIRSLPAIAKVGQFSVTYVLDRLVIAGGTLSVIQLVNELILRGIDARIACRFEDPAVYRWMPFLTRPMVFRSLEELARELPSTDLAVATLWNTAYCVKTLGESGKARQTAYFLQDFEPWFFSEVQKKERQHVIDTYKLIDHKIVKSTWLMGMLNDLGHATTKIPLGLDLETFRPLSGEQKRPSILAMARPGTKRRGFERLCDVVSLVKTQRPDVHVRFFGSNQLKAQSTNFQFEDLGVIEDQHRLAHAYRTSSLFLDTSDFQGFGRCGLEAMACGTATVLTQSGGVTEYANNENSALVEPKKTAIADAVLSLLADPQTTSRLVTQGLIDAEKFSAIEEAKHTEQLFSGLLAKL